MNAIKKQQLIDLTFILNYYLQFKDWLERMNNLREKKKKQHMEQKMSFDNGVQRGGKQVAVCWIEGKSA